MIGIAAAVAVGGLAVSAYGAYKSGKAADKANKINEAAQASADEYNGYLMDVGYREAERADFDWNLYIGRDAFMPAVDESGQIKYDDKGNVVMQKFAFGPDMVSGLTYDQASIKANFELINPQKNLQMAQIEAAQEILPFAKELTKEQMASELAILPKATELTLLGMEAQKGLLPYQTAAAKATLDTVMQVQEAAQHTPTEEELKSRATSNVMQAQAQETAGLKQQLGAAGVKAASGRYTGALADVASAGLKALAQQRTDAGLAARQERLSALTTAASMGQKSVSVTTPTLGNA
jgi:hypothetical protein